MDADVIDMVEETEETEETNKDKIIKMKARAFDLITYREQTNNKVSSELEAIYTKIRELSK